MTKPKLIYAVLFFIQIDLVFNSNYNAALGQASELMGYFYTLFEECINTNIADHRFAIDDLNGFVNAQGMTTVGIPLTAKLTQNRKFLANLLASSFFQEMLGRDVELLRKDLIAKLKFCDTVTMTHGKMKDFYDRDPDA